MMVGEVGMGGRGMMRRGGDVRMAATLRNG